MDARFKEWVEWHQGHHYTFITKSLAAYLGVSTRTIQRWMEDRKYRPTEVQLVKIAEFVKNNS